MNKSNNQLKTRIIVGLSGGVDSSVAALLLQKQGYRVEGLFMKNWDEDDGEDYCTAQQDRTTFNGKWQPSDSQCAWQC